MEGKTWSSSNFQSPIQNNRFSSAGGFSSPNFDAPLSQSQSSGAGSKPKREDQSLLPVTIKQLKNIEARKESSKLRIDGKDVSQITFVGMVLNVSLEQTRINFTIGDGTGDIGVQQFLDNDQEEGKNSIREYMYVRVYGSILGQNSNSGGERTVVAFQIVPVSDYNEITFHMLEVVAVHLRNTKGALQPGQQNGFGQDSGMGMSMGGGGMGMGMGMGMNMGNPGMMMGGGMGGGMGGVDDRGFTPVQQAVMAAIDANHDESGISLHALRGQFPNFNEAQIRDAISFLSSEGHIYDGIDSEHFISSSRQ